MALSVNSNASAVMAMTTVSSANSDLSVSMERLSSGSRLNSASDDAAGIAIVSRLTADIRGNNQAVRNSLDGQALIAVAEGAHKEIENILQRMREVSVQSANDTNNQQDRDNLHAEFSALGKEVDRIASTSTWAGQQMLGETGSSFSFQVGSKVSDSDQINITMGGMTAAILGVRAKESSEGNANSKPALSSTSNSVNSATVNFGGIQQSDITASGTNSSSTNNLSIIFGAGSDVDETTNFESILQNGLLLKQTMNQTGVTYAQVDVTDDMITDLRTHLDEIFNLNQAVSGSTTLSEQEQAQNALSQKQIEVSAFIGSFYSGRDIKLKGQVNANVDDDAIDLFETLNFDGSQGDSILALEIDFKTIFQNITQANHDGGCSCALCGNRNARATNSTNEVASTTNPISSDNELNALREGSKWDLSGDEELTYSFYNGTVPYLYSGDGTPLDPSDFGDTNLEKLREVFALWDNIADFELVEVVETGTTVGELRNAYTAEDIAAQGYSAFPGTTPETKAGDTWYVKGNVDLPNANDFSSTGHGSAGYNYSTAVHEIGHALGLSHPFGHAANGIALEPEVDNFRKTIMSYNDYDRNYLFDYTENGASNFEWVYGSSPGMLDVEAITNMYGFENDADQATDTILTFAPTNSTDGTYEKIHTLIDPGGIDIFDASAFSRNSKINLNPGKFSSLGIYSLDDQVADLMTIHGANNETFFRGQLNSVNSSRQASSQYTEVTKQVWFTGEDNVGLSAGTWIEKALGGSGNDNITGNTQDNYLTGNEGNDTINGGSGFDIAIYNGAKSEFTITDSGNGSYSVSHATPVSDSDGTDTLSSIEVARFDAADGTYEYYEFSSQVAVISASETFSSSDLVLSLASSEGARSAITAVDVAIKQVNIQRSELGAVSNRLNHTVNNLTNIVANLSAARGGIADADFALETTKLAKNQIIQQASTAMLAQANASKQNVLSLLRV